MRKLLFILTVFICINAAGQDTTKLTDTTKFLSYSDIMRLSEKYQDKATYKEYQSFITIINLVIKEAVIEYNQKHKK